jgi:hypothetical protein
MLMRRQIFSSCVVAGAVAAAALGVTLGAQAPQGGAAAQQPPRTPRTASNVDFTGYWVAAITEDWRFRMVTPPKGDFASLPLNAEGTKVGNAWDMDKDIAAGEQCKPFGAAGIMRMPVRLHVTWQDDNNLKMEIDNGNQVRTFHFDRNAPAPAQADWQGHSVAEWETMPQGQGVPAAGGGRGGGPALSGSLKVVTTKMRAGYLRRNGAPYSANAVLTEFYDVTKEPNGDSWLILTSVLDDPTYLNQPLMLTTHYKKEADGSKFSPRPCTMTAPVGANPAN